MKSKFGKRLCSVLLVLALTVLLPTGVLAAEQESPGVTRGQMVTLLWKLEGRPEAETQVLYEDAGNDSALAQPLSWAKEAGLAGGYGNGYFGVDDALTREQMSVMLYQRAKAAGAGFTGNWMFLLDYPDAGQVCDWAYEAVCWNTMHQVLVPSDGQLDPDGSVGYGELLDALQVFCGLVPPSYTGTENPTPEAAYQDACIDSIFAEEEEVLPLVSLTAEDNGVIWNEAGDKVLMLTLHRYPDSYPDGETVSLAWGEVWVTSAGEMVFWYGGNAKGVEDWTVRLEQLLGMPADGKHTHVTAMWVDPADTLRPAYVSQVTEQMRASFDSELPENRDFTIWFENYIRDAYISSDYPWTRLGYTYDWADNGTEYGLTEFLVKSGAQVEVAFTKDVDQFINWLVQEQKP